MSNKQHIIAAKQRQLSAKWTLNIPQTTKSDIEEELLNILTEEIHLESLFEQSVKLGWYGFRKEPTQEWPANEVAAWCKEHCVGLYVHNSNLCIFENKDDAAKFTLTWC